MKGGNEGGKGRGIISFIKYGQGFRGGNGHRQGFI